MAIYTVGTFVKDPSPGDNVIYIYNPEGQVVMAIDPYVSTFYNKIKYVYLLSEGRMDANNVLEFGSEAEANQAIYRLNEIKKIFAAGAQNTCGSIYTREQADATFVHKDTGYTLSPEPIYGDKFFYGNVNLNQDLTVLGTAYFTNTSTNLAITDQYITVNSGETGSGVTLHYAGLKIDRGASPTYYLRFNEFYDTFEIGISGATYPVAAVGEINPAALLFWNPTAYLLTGSNALVFVNQVLTVSGHQMISGNLTASTFYGHLAWNYLTQIPTTLSGYTITDAYTKAEVNYMFGLVSGLTHTLAGLEDVNVTSAQTGDYLVYSAGTWVPSLITLTNYYTKAEVYNTGETNTFITTLNDNLTAHTQQVNPHQTSFFDLVDTTHTHYGFDNSIVVIGNITALTYYGDGSQLSGIIVDHNQLIGVQGGNSGESQYYHFDLTAYTNTLAHTGDTNNPHQVTVEQLSAATILQLVTFTGITLPANYYNQHQIDAFFSGYTGTMVYPDINATQVLETFTATNTDGAEWLYTIKDGANLRTGTIVAAWDLDTSGVTNTDYSSGDLGQTSGFSWDVEVLGDNIRLVAIVFAGNWKISLKRFNQFNNMVVSATTVLNPDIYASQYNISSDLQLNAPVPTKYRIASIVLQETNGNPITGVSIGSSFLGSDVMWIENIRANELFHCPLGKELFSLTTSTYLNISATDWGTGVVDLYLKLEKFAE